MIAVLCGVLSGLAAGWVTWSAGLAYGRLRARQRSRAARIAAIEASYDQDMDHR